MSLAADTSPFDRLSRPRPSRLRQLLRGAMEAATPSKMLMMRQSAESPVPLLTFDDGPHQELTPRILDILHETRLRAAFFMVGEQAAKHLPLVRRAAAEGHIVANHSFSHPGPRTLTTAGYLSDVQRGREVLEQACGMRVAWFRPPHGFLTPTSTIGLWAAGHQLVLWSVDPKDYAAEDASQIVEHLSRSDLTARDVVLLHDNRRVTLEALPRIAAMISPIVPGGAA